MKRLILSAATLATFLNFSTDLQAGLKIRSSSQHQDVNRSVRLTADKVRETVHTTVETGHHALDAIDEHSQQGARILGDAKCQLDEQTDKVREARDQIKSGARVLKTGSKLTGDLAKKLKNKTGVLGKVSSGLESLSRKAKSGSKLLGTGARKLNAGVRTLTSGSKKLQQSTRLLQSVSAKAKSGKTLLTNIGTQSDRILKGSHVTGRSTLKTLKGKITSPGTLLNRSKTAQKLLTKTGGSSLLARSNLAKKLPGKGLTKNLFTKNSSATRLLKGGSPKGLLKNSKFLKSGSKFVKGGVLGAVAEDVVGVDPFKVGKDLITKPQNIVRSLAPANIDRHLQKQAKNLSDNYLKFGHVKKGIGALDRLTKGKMSKTADGLNRLTGGHLGKATKTVANTWNKGVDGVGTIATTGYKGAKQGVTAAAKGIGTTGKVVGNGLKNAGNAVGQKAKAIGSGLKKTGDKVGKFVGGIFGKKK